MWNFTVGYNRLVWRFVQWFPWRGQSILLVCGELTVHSVGLCRANSPCCWFVQREQSLMLVCAERRVHPLVCAERTVFAAVREQSLLLVCAERTILAGFNRERSLPEIDFDLFQDRDFANRTVAYILVSHPSYIVCKLVDPLTCQWR